MPDAPEAALDLKRVGATALAELLERYYPTVHRIAFGLCASAADGTLVFDRVIARALHAMASWRDDTAADRWFYHFTVLESRRHAAAATTAQDPLLNADRPDPAYAAFIRALRSMPAQQRESIILSYGERLNPRYLAVAMDCSGQAAENHLREATRQLAVLTGGQLESLLDALSHAYRALDPQPGSARPLIQRRIHRHLLPSRIRRTVIVVCVCVVAYVVWRWV